MSFNVKKDGQLEILAGPGYSKLSQMESDAEHRTVTDEQIAQWNEGGGEDIPVYTTEEYEVIKDTIPDGTKFIIKDDVQQTNEVKYKDIYDDEERVIGTWFGKPLYRKIFIGSVPAGTFINEKTWYNNYISNVGNIKPINIDLIRNDNNGIMRSLWCRVSNNNLDIWNVAAMGDTALNGAFVILEYTKVGD